MQNITPDHLMRLQFISDAAISPDGTRTAYALHRQNEQENAYESWIHLYDHHTGESRRLTHAGKESEFVWEDANALLFAAERTKEDRPEGLEQRTAFYRLPLHGGEAARAFSVPLRVKAIRPLGGGKYVLSAVVDLNAPSEDADKTVRDDYKDYHVLEEIPFWSNGRGYISRVRSALYLYDAGTEKLERITGEFFNVSAFDARNGRIAYVGCDYQDKRSSYGEARCYDVAAGTTIDLAEPGKYGVEMICLTDGAAVLSLNTFEPYGLCQDPALYRYDFAKGTLSPVGDVGVHVGSAIMTDCAYGGGQILRAVGDDVYFIGQTGFRAAVYRLSAANAVEVAVPFEGNIASLDAAAGQIVFIGQAPNRCGDLYRAATGEAPRRVTDVNADFFAECYVAQAQHVPFVNAGGDTIDGWVLLPQGFDEGGTYPGVLEIHGGPRCTYGDLFFHELQALCGAGYVVLFCNPRGGEGYGEAFADLRGRYGTIDYEDLMAFTDHVLKRYPQIDRARLGAAGGSYGGFMCNWIVGQTDRFAAIASQRSISNWVADFGASEIGFTFDQNEMGATPWTDMQRMWDQSPLKYADRAKTPILFIHSLGDYNCTIDQGVEMFTAMKYFGVPSRMVVFEGENHSLSRSGKPRHRLRRLEEIFAWFARYLA